jgi:hypothetical protein
LKDFAAKAHELIDRLDNKELIIDLFKAVGKGTTIQPRVAEGAVDLATNLSGKIASLYRAENGGG